MHETHTATATIDLDENGHGAVTIDGTARRLDGPDLDAARETAKQRVIEHARLTDQPVMLTVTEPMQTHTLRVTPDGVIAPAPEAPEPAPQADADLSDAELTAEEQRPATEGWRGTLNGLGMHLPPGAAELEERRRAFQQRREEEQARRDAASRAEARSRRQREADRAERAVIQTNFQGSRTILVANPKGGSRKTTTSYCLAATWGIIRGGSVIAWDANETMGTLGDRSAQDHHQRTVVDLLAEAPGFSSVETSRLGSLDAFVRSQGDSHFQVLASDEDPNNQDMVDSQGFATVHDILARFYRVIFVDTGNNIRASHFIAARDIADQLVIPIAAAKDSADAAMKMIDAFKASGHSDLVESAVVLLHELTPSEPGALGIAQNIAADFAPQVSAVVPVPFDPALKDGQRIDYATLHDRTKAAYQHAAAAVADSMIRRETYTRGDH